MILREGGAPVAKPAVIPRFAPPRFDPRTALGPIVHFRGLQPDPVQPEGRWRLAVVFVVPGEAEPPDLRVDGVRLTLPPRHVATMAGHGIWRFDFSIQRDRGDARIGYGFGDERWFVTVPGLGAAPRMACLCHGGVDDEAGLRAAGLSPTARWADLMARHRQEPFHIGLHGGGQIEAGNPFAAIPALAEWMRRSLDQRRAAPLTPAMAAGLDTWYAGLYLRQWRGAERAALMASLPAVMIWGDTDIAAGLAEAEGPWSPPLGQSPVVRAVMAAARAAFCVFQLGLGPEEARQVLWGRSWAARPARPGPGGGADAHFPGGFTQGWRAGPVGILALDACATEPVPPALLQDWLDRFAGCRQLVVLTGAPLTLPAPGRVARLLAGRHRRVSRSQTPETAAALGVAAARLGLGITVVTAAHRSAGAARLPGVLQLLAGNMSLAAAPARLVDRLERAAATEGFDAVVLPGTGRRFLRGRHWLALDVAGEAPSARWHVEERAATVDLPL
jgi:hypothetical protein